jgi:hypothetical protein
MVAEIRAQLDESNVDSVSDSADIFPSMNRALDYASSVLAKRYPDPFIRQLSIPVASGEQEIELPEDCFEDRILKLEVDTGGSFQELRRVSFYDLGSGESTSPTSISRVYAVVGRNIRLDSPSLGTYPLRIWYMRQPEELVPVQGRITVVNIPGNYVIVDSVGADVSTESDTLESYVNIVDGQSGAIKQTLQCQVLADGRITFRTLPTRGEVLNRTVSFAIETTVGLDDQVCPVRGTCVPEFSQPLCNFIIQYTVSEITRKLGGDAQTEESILKKFEAQVGGTWSGRENTTRVKLRSNSLSSSRRNKHWFPLTQK